MSIFSYLSDQRANCYEFLKIKDRNCLYTCFLGKFFGKTETLRSISSFIPTSFGCVFGMVGNLFEEAFQRVFFSYFSDQRANCYEFLKIKDRNCHYTCFLGKFYGKTEILRSISSLIPTSFGYVFGMVGKLYEQAFQRVFFHIFLINVQIVMNF